MSRHPRTGAKHRSLWNAPMAIRLQIGRSGAATRPVLQSHRKRMIVMLRKPGTAMLSVPAFAMTMRHQVGIHISRFRTAQRDLTYG
jgi:hypothetical protein